MIFRTTGGRTQVWPVYLARMLGICLMCSAFFASCRKEAPTDAKPSNPSTVKTLEPFFRVHGYEDKIDPDYGLPLQGLVATSVRYDLGAIFPPTEFFEALQRDLHELGWFTPEFTFTYSPEPASKGATWEYLPGPKSSGEISEQWWVRADQVILVFGQHLLSTDGEDLFPAHVYVVISLFDPGEAARKLHAYRELHGKLPTAPGDARVLRANDSGASTGDP